MKKRIIAILLAALMVISLVSLSGCTQQPAEGGEKTYTVGICQLAPHPALDAATKGFRDVLTEKLGDKVSFDEQNAAGEASTAATICNQFVANKVDLIMGNATNALQAAAAATNTIPILGTSITDYASALGTDPAKWEGTTGINVSGTSDLAPLDQQAAMVAELFPAANFKNVGILYCSGEPNSLYQVKVITPALEALGFTVTAFSFADSNDVAAVAANACANSDVLFIPTDNTAATCTEAINNVALPAKTPIIAGEENICKGCGVATLSISYEELGRKTGEMAYEVLVNGADVSAMTVQTADNVTKKYNAAIVEQLGITVPEGYVAIEG